MRKNKEEACGRREIRSACGMGVLETVRQSIEVRGNGIEEREKKRKEKK